MKKPILVIDVDGVLCDLVGAAIPVINERYKCHLQRSDIRMFDMDLCVGVQREHFNEIFRLLDYSQMKVIDGAVEATQKLSTAFHIVVATSRPPALHTITENWLRDNGIVFHEFMSLNGNKTLFTNKSHFYPKAHALIDDDLREVVAASVHARLTCLLDSPWNHSINANQSFVRCFTWDDIVEACVS